MSGLHLYNPDKDIPGELIYPPNIGSVPEPTPDPYAEKIDKRIIKQDEKEKCIKSGTCDLGKLESGLSHLIGKL
tara:strand:- start:1430 stop:1651 length:222 start_codon:yes stop_codon:yes gene_type:complete